MFAGKKRGPSAPTKQSRLLMISTVLFLTGTAFAINAPSIRIRIDTVPDHYSPTDATINEPVSMQDFHFEVNPETRRARIVVDYSYPDEFMYERNDDNRGPKPTIAQIPGLKYDVVDQQVVYWANGKISVCANVEDHKGIFGRHLRVKSTGVCTVKVEDVKHAKDDGWAIRRFKAIDTYFEVR
ncbi:MAG TPA: hypothetical protein VN684_06370 [Terriglobales bacterium]|nr:hypothetical protein [Terriglobales bacterium]